MTRVQQYARRTPRKRLITMDDWDNLREKIGTVSEVTYNLCGGLKTRGTSRNDIDICADPWDFRPDFNARLSSIGLEHLEKAPGGQDVWLYTDDKGDEILVDVFWGGLSNE